MVRTPEHQFLRYLMNLTGKLPGDPFYDNIDPFLKIYLYEGWIHDLELDIERKRNQSIFLGSFFNPEAAQKLYKSENPDHKSSEEDLEKSTQMVRQDILREDGFKQRTKKRSKIID